MRGCVAPVRRWVALGLGGFWWLGWLVPLHAQPLLPPDTLAHQQQVQLNQLTDTLALNHAHLQPVGFSIRDVASGQMVPREHYWFNPQMGRLALQRPQWLGQALLVQYRRWPGPPPGALALRDTTLRAPDASGGGAPVYRDTVTARTPERTPGAGVQALTRSGSISRAVTVGTGRDLAVNSDLRLQLSGPIAEGVDLSASLTDDNLPIQPSGTTQQLTDFDRIFIQLKRKNQRLTLGDLELSQQGTTFSDLYRNVLGVQFSHSTPQWGLSVAGSAGKGRFATNSFQGQNGNQGPYPLVGAEQERFIVILAGSERVYVNGRALTRGEDQDYVIEYNTAELTFTPRVPIDINARVVVDFEYAVQSYARSFILGQYYDNRLLGGRLKLKASYAREADNPDAPLDLSLTEADRLVLQQAGDDPQAAALNGVDSLGYTPAEVRYLRQDTTIGSFTYPGIFVASTDSERAVFRVTFSFVGAGRGDYVRSPATINGNVFRWTAPDTLSGTPTGDYIAARVVTLPQLTQVLALAARYKINKSLQLEADAAGSSTDRNRLSALDEADNQGGALRLALRADSVKVGAGLWLGGSLAGQYVEDRYRNIDRVFAKEYGRQWNFNDQAQRGTERLLEGSVHLTHRRGYRLEATGGYRQGGDSLQSRRATLQLTSTDSSRVLGQLLTEWIDTRNRLNGQSSQWWRQTGDIYVLRGPKKGLALGTELWLESRTDRQADSLQVGSFRFADFTPYIRYSVPGQRLSGTLRTNVRYDQAPLGGVLTDRARTLKPGVQALYRPGQGVQLELTASYLSYTVLNDSFRVQGLADQQALLGNLRTQWLTPRGLVNLSAFYEVSAEQQVRRQVVYVEVPAGQGQYEWIDYDADGTQDLGEFELAVDPLRANFVRLLSPTATRLPAVRISTGGTLRLEPRKVMPRARTGLMKLIRETLLLTTLRLEQRTQRPPGQLRTYLPAAIQGLAEDTTVLNAQFNLRQDVIFYRNNPKGEVGFSYQQIGQQLALEAGSELRQARVAAARQRLNLTPRHTLENLLEFQRRETQAQDIPTREVNLTAWRAAPSYVWQATRRIRLTAGYGVAYRTNRSPATSETGNSARAELVSHRINAEIRINFKGRNNFFTRTEWVNNSLIGTVIGSAQFELLEGLSTGQNVVSSALLTQYLTPNLELSVVYNGRWPGQLPSLQAVRVQIRALL